MKWKPLFAVLLGLLMVGVTAGSAVALSSPREGISVKARELSNSEKITISKRISNLLADMGISTLKVEQINGWSVNGKYIFWIETSDGTIIGAFDGKDYALTKVISLGPEKMLIKEVSNNGISTVAYNTRMFSGIDVEKPKIQITPGEHWIYQPEYHKETHWYGWKVSFTEWETNVIIDLAGTAAGAAALATAIQAYLGLPTSLATGVTVAVIGLGISMLKFIDDLGHNKGIYIAQYIWQMPWRYTVWHN